MNYSVRKTGPNAARIAIESSPFVDHKIKPEIWLFTPRSWNLLSIWDEAVIGRAENTTCALVFTARRHDVIATREMLLDGRETAWNYYRIDSNFRLQPISNESSAESGIAGPAQLDAQNEEPQPNGSEEEEFRRFFTQRHPRWLQEIVDRQIRQWRESSPDRFFRFAPDALVERGIKSCVAEAPFAALARFKHVLNELQIQDCISRSPRGAVIHAMEHVPEEKRENYLVGYAKEAIRFSAEKLTDRELARCAWIDMRTGFALRTRFSHDRRAILLANSYPINFHEGPTTPFSDLHREIGESLTEFHEQWKASDPAGFPSIFRNLREQLSMSLEPHTFSALMERIGPDDQAAVANFVASLM